MGFFFIDTPTSTAAAATVAAAATTFGSRSPSRCTQQRAQRTTATLSQQRLLASPWPQALSFLCVTFKATQQSLTEAVHQVPLLPYRVLQMPTLTSLSSLDVVQSAILPIHEAFRSCRLGRPQVLLCHSCLSLHVALLGYVNSQTLRCQVHYQLMGKPLLQRRWIQQSHDFSLL